jgi:hypothetical protein
VAAQSIVSVVAVLCSDYVLQGRGLSKEFLIVYSTFCPVERRCLGKDDTSANCFQVFFFATDESQVQQFHIIEAPRSLAWDVQIANGSNPSQPSRSDRLTDRLSRLLRAYFGQQFWVLCVVSVIPVLPWSISQCQKCCWVESQARGYGPQDRLGAQPTEQRGHLQVISRKGSRLQVLHRETVGKEIIHEPTHLSPTSGWLLTRFASVASPR